MSDSPRNPSPPHAAHGPRPLPLGEGKIWHPFTQHGLAGPAVNITKAEGAHLFTKDGRKIIDGISSWWVNTHGHCRPEIVSAVQEQAAKLEQVIFAGFTHEPAEELAEKLLRFANGNAPPPTPPLAGGNLIETPPRVRGGGAQQRFSHVFFSDSGSTSVEAALKMAIGFWAHNNKPRSKIVAMDHGYHGDTFGAMAAGARGPFTRLYDPYLFDVTRIPFPEAGVESRTVDKFESILLRSKGEVAALILEPLILGAGGMKTYSAAVLTKLRELCDQYGVLLILDEVLTGFGRTGTMFACEQAGITPDIMCLSKGLTGGFLPMGATLCSEKIYKAFYSADRSKMFFHSSSFTGNALACAAAVANLKIWETESVLERVKTISKSHETAISRFSKREDISDVRHLGTIFALDVIPSEAPQGAQSRDLTSIPSPAGSNPSAPLRSARDDNMGYLAPIAPRLYDFFMARDVLLRPLGNTVYILPPYCIEPEDLNHVYDVIELALDSLRHDGQQRAA